MLELRKNAEGILRRIGKGERLILSHRGRPAARLEPISATEPPSENDPFVTIGRRAVPSPKGRTSHSQLDQIVYGQP